jgi:hypothetical protein
MCPVGLRSLVAVGQLADVRYVFITVSMRPLAFMSAPGDRQEASTSWQGCGCGRNKDQR